MTGLLLHVGMTAICPHGGQVSVVSTNTRVKVSGQFVVTMSDIFTITGCVFTIPPGVVHPCVLIKWIVPASRVTVMGQPVLLTDSTGLCQAPDQSPQGPPNIIVTQLTVTGT